MSRTLRPNPRFAHIFKSFVFALLLAPFLSDAQTVSWLKKAGDVNSNVEGFGLVIDHSHNVISSGVFEDTAMFGAITLRTTGSFEGYLAKYDSSGNVLWAKSFGGTGFDCGGKAAVDQANNIYVTGFFKGTSIYFTPTDSLVKNAPGAISNSFLAKYDPNGNFVWAKQITSSSQVESYAITVDAWDNIIMGGTLHNDVTIGSTTLSNPYYNVYIAKFNTSGTLKWMKMGASMGLCKVNDLATDAAGKIYATGKLSSDMTWGTLTRTAPGGDDAFYAKFDSLGVATVFKTMGGTYFITTTTGEFDAGNAIRPDKLGNFYVGGSLLLTTTSSPTDQQGYFGKFNDTGGVIWINYFGRVLEKVSGIVVDPQNNPYVCGLKYGTDTIGGMAVPYTAGASSFIGKFDNATGNAIWIKSSVGSGSGNDLIGYVAAGRLDMDRTTGSLVGSGQFLTSIGWDTWNVTSSTVNELYLVRILNYIPGLAGVPLVTDPESIVIYPNPATTVLNFRFGNSPWHKIVITDEMGRQVREWEVNANTFAADIRAVAPGNYMVVITDNTGIRVTRKVTRL